MSDSFVVPNSSFNFSGGGKTPFPLVPDFSNKKYYIIVAAVVIFVVVVSGGIFLSFQQKGNNSSTLISPTQAFGATFPTAKIEISPTSAQYIFQSQATPLPTKSIPTNKLLPSNTPVPLTSTPKPTSTPQPTPTRTPNPPIIDISYPSAGQYVEFTSPSQQFCMVDVPAGGDTSGLQRKHSINDASWSSYTSIFTLCFTPNEGTNRIQLQYKNQYGEESQQYNRQFNFHKAY